MNNNISPFLRGARRTHDRISEGNPEQQSLKSLKSVLDEYKATIGVARSSAEATFISKVEKLKSRDPILQNLFEEASEPQNKWFKTSNGNAQTTNTARAEELQKCSERILVKFENIIDQSTLFKDEQSLSIVTNKQKTPKEVLNDWVAKNGNKENYSTAANKILECIQKKHTSLDLGNLDLENLPPPQIFKELDFLQTLKFNYNPFTMIEAGIFSNLRNLKTLSLRGCELATITIETFSKLNALEELDLSDCNLEEIKTNVFNSLTNLKMLDLSLNKLATIITGAFNGLANLRNLSIDCNELNTLNTNIFNGLGRLETLDLASNKLTKIEANAFYDLANLRELSLCDNQLTTLAIDTFNSLANLEQLDLSYNLLTRLAPTTLNNLTNLEQLNLSHNQLATLAIDTFDSLANLEQLDLSHNELASIETGTFNSLDNLKLLHLNNNELITISNYTFDNMAILEFLDLRNNNFNSLAEDAFNGLEECVIHCPEREKFKSGDFKAQLMDILRRGKNSYQLTQDWNNMPAYNNEAFKTFFSRIGEIADIKFGNRETRQTVWKILADIIVKIDSNEEIREQCMEAALVSIENCGDAVHFGFLRMQLIANKLNYNDEKVDTLFDNQKKLLAFEYVIKDITRNKIEFLRSQIPRIEPDNLEVGLAYLKGLKDLLGIEISSMLYESMSHVTKVDIEAARELLTGYMNEDDNIYLSLIETSIIKRKFSKEFEIIDEQYESADDSEEMRKTNIELRDNAKMDVLRQQIRLEFDQEVEWV